LTLRNSDLGLANARRWNIMFYILYFAPAASNAEVQFGQRVALIFI